MTDTALAGAVPRRRSWLPYALVCGVFIAAKLVIFLSMNPIGDEAYYWLWGQHLDWSYFDHPPLHAWLLRATGLLLGWNLLSLRALTWLTFAGTLLIFWHWSKRLQPADPAEYFWRATAIYLAAPLFLGMSTIAFNDHLMMFCVVASAHFMLRFAEDWEAGRRRHTDLYLAAALLGLAVLSKYNAVFLGLGYVVFFLVRRPLRGLYANPHTYAAGLLSIAIQAPVLWWNLNRNFASYDFHFTRRWSGALHFTWEAVAMFIIVAAIVVSPFLLYAVLRYCFRRPAEGFESRAHALAVSTFAVSSVSMLVLASFAEVLFYWNIVAFILMLPLLPLAMGRRLVFWLHVLYGLAMASLLMVNQYVAPLGNLFGAYDWTISSTYGWDQTGKAVEAARAEHDADFVATTFYTTAAQLGFATHNPDVTALSPRPDQFDIWFNGEAHRGQSAIIVADPYFPIELATPMFDRVTPLSTVTIDSFGRTIYSPTLYFAEGFRPLETQ